MIKVNFRVTGMYVGNSPDSDCGQISVEVDKNPKVCDIMFAVSKAAFDKKIPNLEAFIYSPSNPSQTDSINAIYAVFTNAPRKNRPAGLYGLQDNATTNPIQTFQYYIYDEDFKQLNNNNENTTFGNHPDVEIKDGYTLIIRQVSILMTTIQSSYINAKIAKFNALLV